MELGLALLERLDGDVVLSPYGLARALNVVREGATGETRARARRGRRRRSRRWTASCPPRRYGSATGYTAGPALTGSTPARSTSTAINAWSNEKTRGMIPRILDELGDDEVFALTDAEYLDAQWVFPFEAATRSRTRRLMRVDGDLRARRGRGPAALPRAATCASWP